MQITTIDLHFQQKEEAIASFLVQHEGTCVLVETGAYSTFEHLKTSIEQQGVALEAVQHVFITHIHLDHAGAAWAFAERGANIYLHPFGYNHMANPEKLMESARRIYKEHMDTLWGEMKAIAPERLQVVEDEQIIAVGELKFKAWHTPGHANHHIAWQLDEVVFTGDVAGVKIANGPVVAPCPPPDIDIEKWLQSVEVLRKINPKAFYLTHFGKVENIAQHLDALQDNLQKQAEWIKNAVLQGGDAPSITPKFDAWAVAELKALGLNAQEILSYQLANPAWMSVAGLMRYWDKKKS